MSVQPTAALNCFTFALIRVLSRFAEAAGKILSDMADILPGTTRLEELHERLRQSLGGWNNEQARGTRAGTQASPFKAYSAYSWPLLNIS